MRKIIAYLPLATVLAGFFLYTCSTPQNPYQDPKNADIASVELFSPASGTTYTIGDSLTLTINLAVAKFVTSLDISIGSYWDTTITRLPSDPSSIIITCLLTEAGDITVLVSAAITNGDTKTKAEDISVTGLAPSVATSQPRVSVAEGGTLSLSVTASGTGPFSYVWKKETVIIVGATAASYLKPSVAQADSGMYRCIVTSPWGVDSSDNIFVSILPAGTPIAPTNLLVISKSDSSVTLRWNTADSATGYGVYRHMTASFGSASRITTVTSNFFVDDADFVSTNYYYWVTALRGTRESTQSDSVFTGRSIVTINHPPAWSNETLLVSAAEGKLCTLDLAESCIDSDSNTILSYSYNGTYPQVHITKDSLFVFTAEKQDSGAYEIPVIAFDGQYRDTALVLVTVSATYCTLTISAPVNGTIMANPARTKYRYGDSIEVTASPLPTYEFDQWNGALAGKPASTWIIMNGSQTISARFIPTPECDLLISGSSINQNSKQVNLSNSRPKTFCLEDQGIYENNTVKVHGKVRVSIR